MRVCMYVCMYVCIYVKREVSGKMIHGGRFILGEEKLYRNNS